jgi:ribonuclease-3
MDLAPLSVALGHAFADRQLLRTALTHRSFGSSNNERLEFLGDGVLQSLISIALFKRFPDLTEGELTRLRASLVRREALHRIALALHLGDYLLLGEGAVKTGGRDEPSILADAVEALIGAAYVDGGYDAAAEMVARLYLPLFDEIKGGVVDKDPKTRLQEWLQGRKRSLPAYILVGQTGMPPKEQVFEVACEIDQPRLRTVGQGRSKRIAEQAAAESALRILEA